MATNVRRGGARWVRRHTRAAVGAAVAGLAAPAVLIAILVGRSGRRRGLQFLRRWQGRISTELDKWR